MLGKVLMEDVRAKEPYPPFAASVKDGYAVIGNATFYSSLSYSVKETSVICETIDIFL